MALTTKESILKVLNAYNPWWKTGATNPALTKTYKRFAFYDAMSKLENKSIRRTVVLTGTRRVGKTTIQYQMIDELLKKGVHPKKIVFVSLDHPMLKLSAFEDILEFHVMFEKIHPFQDGNGRVGRLIMFKECLKHNIVPFIIEDNLKMFYYRGLKEWSREKGFLTDTCLTAQDKYKAYLDYFRIEY